MSSLIILDKSFVGKKLSTIGNSITDTITKVGQKFSGGAKGDNFWTRISKGFKNLFNSAKEVTPKFKKGMEGNVDVFNIKGHHAVDTPIWTNVKSSTAESMIKNAERLGLDTPLLRGQTLGSPEGWITQKGGSTADRLITETINKASENTVKALDNNSLKYFNDLKGTGQFDNNQEILDRMFNNGTKYEGLTDWDGIYNTDLSKTGDYKLLNPNEPTSYTFTGDKTFDNPVAKKFKYKEKINKAKKTSYKWISYTF